MTAARKNHSAAWRRISPRLALLILGPAIAVALALYFYFTGGRYESTDDAYVQTARVAVSSNVAGRVVELAVRDNQPVHRGDLLYRLEDAPFAITVQQAEAQLAAARLQVESLKASYRQYGSRIAAGRRNLEFLRNELDRQQRLLRSGIASQAAVDRARNALDDASGAQSSLEHQADGALAQLGGDPSIPPEKHPALLQAQAALDAARLDLSYTTVRAPADGVVTRVEELQVGDFVAAHAPVFALVATGKVWVEANFKEDQLAHMQPGQHVTVKLDSYPGHTFDGTVGSLSPGTGSQFSALPPENATGNWVKVVQRLPVRIELQLPEATPALHAGLSATVRVDTGYSRL
ncbi:MAG: HlyD family secretion protein [Steroidobacteraceae bacterium]